MCMHRRSFSCVWLFATLWSLPGSSVHGTLQTRILEWVANALLQGIFLTQGSNPCLLHWKAESLPLSHQASPLSRLGTWKKRCMSSGYQQWYKQKIKEQDRALLGVLYIIKLEKQKTVRGWGYSIICYLREPGGWCQTTYSAFEESLPVPEAFSFCVFMFLKLLIGNMACLWLLDVNKFKSTKVFLYTLIITFKGIKIN